MYACIVVYKGNYGFVPTYLPTTYLSYYLPTHTTHTHSYL